MRIEQLNRETKEEVIRLLSDRIHVDYEPYMRDVSDILRDIRERGDKALFEYTQKFDGCAVDSETIRVTEDEIQEACASVGVDFMEVLNKSAKNIMEFHKKNLQESWIDTSKKGVMLGQKITPLESAGVYVPGGKAAYPSSVLMNIIPAKTAGVGRVAMATPPGADGRVNPYVLAAASVCGADEIYRMGGAQAIAAFAYGTESIRPTVKITGPGNIYVALAKRAVFGTVAVDSIAGPSEITVLADETADPCFVAADMLSQAEHDEAASAILVTTSEALAVSVIEKIEEMMQDMPRNNIIAKSLSNHGIVLIAEDMEAAIDAVNLIAPEHLEIQTADPIKTMEGVKNAGAIFLGAYSCEPLGDYFAGPNHILPTNGTARFFSPLGAYDFIKKSSIISYDREAFAAAAPYVSLFAKTEGLDAHANSINVRMKNQEGNI